MGKKKNNQLKTNKSAQKTDAEFATEDGLEKVAIRAQKKSK